MPEVEEEQHRHLSSTPHLDPQQATAHTSSRTKNAKANTLPVHDVGRMISTFIVLCCSCWRSLTLLRRLEGDAEPP